MKNIKIRVGHGIDVHRFVKGRPLILGGIEIPFEKGLEGHSDADVAIHAIIDALLGAAALGDIGAHFPDTDPQYKNISSTILLKRTITLINEHGFQPGNIDVTIVAQKPKMRSYIPEIRRNLSSILELAESYISVKATTTENMGFAGRGEGILAIATATVI
ncbi:MAG: 2-C-methyl-D-erythritol 2,4-cyclodiphosphate synthase [Candidatus Neomarinimicrobiota bacterium]|nr:MAG: 2-C-methyl-D-erythritol 2,4-cyclodiphosphate synthase [Candidatus Neomarinimicrobiota bacterium]